MSRLEDEIMSEKSEIAHDRPFYGIGMTFSIGNGHTLTLQTMMPQDTPLPVLNRELDKMHSALSRQFSKSSLPGHRIMRARLEEGFVAASKSFAAFDEAHKGQNLTSKVTEDRRRIVEDADRAQRALEEVEKVIKLCEDEIADGLKE